MAGIFGNDPIDRWMDENLERHLEDFDHKGDCPCNDDPDAECTCGDRDDADCASLDLLI